MTKEEFQRDLIRMWDSIRTDNKGAENCGGVRCLDCPLYMKTQCGSLYTYEALEIIENWVKEHPIVTNADKFKEVFGLDMAPIHSCVGSKSCEDCEYTYDGKCAVSRLFWNAKYKGKTEGCEEE